MNLRASNLAATPLMCTTTLASEAQAPATDEAAFRDLYKQLVEINTARSVGSCTRGHRRDRWSLSQSERHSNIWSVRHVP